MHGSLFHIDLHQEEFLHKNNTPATNKIDINEKHHIYMYVYDAKLHHDLAWWQILGSGLAAYGWLATPSLKEEK